jgi:hypothetical protein
LVIKLLKFAYFIKKYQKNVNFIQNDYTFVSNNKNLVPLLRNFIMKVGLKQIMPFLVLTIIAVAAVFVPSLPDFPDTGKYSGADIAWLLVATALVFLMTPGLAFFYGGMVHRKNVISTMIKSVVAAGVVSILWVTVGFSLSFGESLGGIIGDPRTFIFSQRSKTTILY